MVNEKHSNKEKKTDKKEISPSEYKLGIDDIDACIRACNNYMMVKNFKFATDTANFALDKFDKYMTDDRKKTLNHMRIFCYTNMGNFSKAYLAMETMLKIECKGDNFQQMDVEAINNVACLALNQKRYDSALALFNKVIEHQYCPGFYKKTAMNNIGYIYIQTNQVWKGLEVIENIIKIIKQQPQDEQMKPANVRILDDCVTNYNLSYNYVCNNISELTRTIKQKASLIPYVKEADELKEEEEYCASGTKKRLAFISGNFCNHSVMWFVYHLLIREYSKFDVYILNYNPPESNLNPIVEDLKKLYGIRYVDLSPMRQQYDYVIKMIKKMKLDVIIHLDGYTGNTSNLILKHQVAPLQISYCGFPTYMMTDFIQYRISDDTVDNRKEQIENGLEAGAEPILSMGSSGFLCFNTERAPKELKINITNPNEKKTIMVAMRMEKINKETIDTWNELFTKIKGYEIVFCFGITMGDNKKEAVELTKQLKMGENTYRIVSVLKDEIYYEQFLGAVLMIDTVNGYGGTTRPCQALMMGTPIITIQNHKGLNIQNPMSSMLKQCNMSEYIANNKDEYINKIIYYLQHPPNRDDVRKKFIEGNNVIKHGELFEKKIYEAYELYEKNKTKENKPTLIEEKKL